MKDMERGLNGASEKFDGGIFWEILFTLKEVYFWLMVQKYWVCHLTKDKEGLSCGNQEDFVAHLLIWLSSFRVMFNFCGVHIDFTLQCQMTCCTPFYFEKRCDVHLFIEEQHNINKNIYTQFWQQISSII